jgi:hypothetical protein
VDVRRENIGRQVYSIEDALQEATVYDKTGNGVVHDQYENEGGDEIVECLVYGMVRCCCLNKGKSLCQRNREEY